MKPPTTPWARRCSAASADGAEGGAGALLSPVAARPRGSRYPRGMSPGLRRALRASLVALLTVALWAAGFVAVLRLEPR